MNIPATDALSLALAHENSPRRRSMTRSPSPFSATSNSGKRVTRRVIRRISGGLQPPPESPQVTLIDIDEEEAQMIAKQLQAVAAEHANGNGNAKDTPKKIDWEIPRKVLHSSIGFFTVYLYLSQRSPQQVTTALWAALAIITPADVLRLNCPPFARLYNKYLGFLMRESEKKTTNGVIWYILGVNFALQFYPLDVATVAILILSWADTAASTFGRLWGRYTPPLPRRLPILPLPLAPRKSLAGFIAASVTGACIAATFWTYVAQARPASWTFEHGVSDALRTEGVNYGISWNGGGWLGLAAISIVAALVSGIAEALDLSLDDNLTLPIISGGCILGFFKLLGMITSSW